MLRDGLINALRGSCLRVKSWLLGRDGEDASVQRRRRRSRTRFSFGGEGSSRQRLLRIGLTAALTGVFLFSAVKLIGYGVDYIGARLTSASLRKTYYAQATPPTLTSTPVVTAEPTATPTPTPEATLLVQTVVTPKPTATPLARLPKKPYPHNPYAIANTNFQKLRRQNEDIIGWLTIGKLVDEAVVQRNNTYYLDRDYRGYHNKNGAIFLDESCDLRTRPYTLTLYGHNMKTGLMFGGLRNYENPTYYHNDPFITFNTLYEDGRYVIFAVSTVSTDASKARYVDFSGLISTAVVKRTEAIKALQRFSVYRESIDVQPEDQLLLLVTCVDAQEDRRVVAARRIRDGESEAELLQQVKKIRKW